MASTLNDNLWPVGLPASDGRHGAVASGPLRLAHHRGQVEDAVWLRWEISDDDDLLWAHYDTVERHRSFVVDGIRLTTDGLLLLKTSEGPVSVTMSPVPFTDMVKSMFLTEGLTYEARPQILPPISASDRLLLGVVS